MSKPFRVTNIDEFANLLSSELNGCISKIMNSIDDELKKLDQTIKSNESKYYDICIGENGSIPKLEFSILFKYQIYKFGKLLKSYKKIIPEFECEIYIYPFESRADLVVDYAAKSILNKDLIENRQCHVFQAHQPKESFNYTSDKDHVWNDYRVRFYFKFPLNYHE
jgi:hypothetical protein